MKMVCSNYDLGLKCSDCTDEEYIECECRRWFSERFKYEDLTEKTVWFIENILNVKLRDYHKEIIDKVLLEGGKKS